MAPRKVMLVRHAEKVGDPACENLGGPDLSLVGFARAAALPALFAPAASALACSVELVGGTLRGTYRATGTACALPRFETPDVIMATRDSDHSCRPRQTAGPAAAALGAPFDYTTYSHKPEGVAKLSRDLLDSDGFAGKVVLVFWHHGTIPDIAASLGVVPRPAWPGDDVFDRVWCITFDADARLSDAPQRLLFGDR